MVVALMMVNSDNRNQIPLWVRVNFVLQARNGLWMTPKRFVNKHSQRMNKNLIYSVIMFVMGAYLDRNALRMYG